MTNHIRDALAAANELSRYAAAPFFPGQDKRGIVRETSAEWWDGLAELIERAQPLIGAALGAVPDGRPAAASAAVREALRSVVEAIDIGRTIPRDEVERYRSLAAAPDVPPAGARELVAALVKHIERNECQHESTHRGGVLWTICDDCGKKWADDEGGFVPYERPSVLLRADDYLATPPAGEAKPMALCTQCGADRLRQPCAAGPGQCGFVGVAEVAQVAPLMANGLTEAETTATASVAGLTQAAPVDALPELPGPSGDAPSDFQEGQWWLVELDKASSTGSDDLKRAVAVVRNLMRTAHAQALVRATPKVEAKPLTEEQIEAFLPRPDGASEANAKRIEVLPGVMGTEFDEVDAWSLPLIVQAIRAIERTRGIGTHPQAASGGGNA